MGQPTAAQSVAILKITGSGSIGSTNWQVHDENKMGTILSVNGSYLFSSTRGALVCKCGLRRLHGDGNLLCI